MSGIGRDLSGRDLILTGLTTDVCAGQCQPIGYPYFGLQFGERCFCGDNFGSRGASIGQFQLFLDKVLCDVVLGEYSEYLSAKVAACTAEKCNKGVNVACSKI